MSELRDPGGHSSVGSWPLAVAVGGLASLSAILLGTASTKFIVAGVLGLALLGALPLLMARGNGEPFLIVVLALSIPFSPNINFLLFADHVGGAASLQVQAAGLALIGLISLGVSRIFSGQSLGWTTDWRIGAGIAIYISISSLSLFNSFFPALTALELLRLVQFFLTFLIVSNIRDRKLLNLFVASLAMGALLQGGIALAQYTLGRELGLKFLGEGPLFSQDIGFLAKRASGTIGHPNQLAYYFEILIPVFFAMLFAHRAACMRWICGIALVASLGGVLTTLSRGAWLSVPLSLSMVFMLIIGQRILSKRGSLATLAMLLVLCGALVGAWSTIEKRFTSNDHQSSASRLPLNMGAISIIEQYPFLGVGLNNFSEVFHELDQTGNARIFRTGIPGKSAYYKQVVHNMYLLVWAEVGTVGLLAFLGQFLVVFWTLLRRPMREDRQWYALAVGISAGLMAQLFHGLFDPGYKTTFNVSLLVYVLFGLVAATNLGIRDDHVREA